MSASRQLPPFNPPGPGTWELERAHFPRPLPKFGLHGLIRGFRRGLAFGAAKYGLLIEGFDVALVNGFWYQRRIPFVSLGREPAALPRLATWLATRLHPGILKRIRTGRRAFTEKRWREDLALWDEVEKPRALAAHRCLLAIAPNCLSDRALVEHLRACDAHVESMVYLHQKYAVPCLAPIGDLLAQVHEWTGLGPSEVLGLTRGSSGAALGFAVRELEALAEAVRMDGSIRAILAEEGDERKSLAALLALKCPAGEAARGFMNLVRYRAIGYDVGERLVSELPEVIIRCLKSVVDGHFRPTPDDAATWTRKVRGSIPAKYHAEFDGLVAEARMMSRLRDERGMYADCFAIGIARRALLEAGARLEAHGRLHDREHAVDLTISEFESLFSNHGAPSADMIERRVTWRMTTTVTECPSHLGPVAREPPSPTLLPMDARRPARALAAVMAGIYSETHERSACGVIRGLSVNRGVYEGVARKVDGPSEFRRIRRGDVLVTRTTGSSFNFVLPLLGAIVTDRGGQLSHAAIVAREYGIPGVVGTNDATTLIPDGARVRVDGTRAEVTVL